MPYLCRKKMRFISSYIVILLLLGCESDTTMSELNLDKEEDRTLIYAEGKRLMENKCYVCHNPKVKEKHLIAPPLVEVKQAYFRENEVDFIEEFINFLNSPDKAKAKLPDAVEKYGLMPYQRYDKESLRKIALYIYNNQIETPEWWEGEQHGKTTIIVEDNTAKNYLDIGLEFALTTKQVLGTNLMGTIQREGVEAAVDFCHLAAFPLTDSMAQVHQAQIQRISDKPRNPKNAAEESDLKYIRQYKELAKTNSDMLPTVIERENDVLFYHPIITNDKCLLCHGQKTNIEKNVLAILEERYPNDQATGYEVNEVRGLWKIIFSK
jgi:hypothetical protein